MFNNDKFRVMRLIFTKKYFPLWQPSNTSPHQTLLADCFHKTLHYSNSVKGAITTVHCATTKQGIGAMVLGLCKEYRVNNVSLCTSSF